MVRHQESPNATHKVELWWPPDEEWVEIGGSRGTKSECSAVAAEARRHGDRVRVVQIASFVAVLRERWIAKRNEFIGGKRIPGKICDGPDDYARRERRAYRLALVWSRDRSLPGEWWWCQRDQRWDVYPQREPSRLMRVVRHGHWFEFFHPEGCKACESYILVRRADPTLGQVS